MLYFLQKNIFAGFVINFLVIVFLGWTYYSRKANEKEIIRLEQLKEDAFSSIDKINSDINAIGNRSKGFALTREEKFLGSINIEEIENISRHLSQMFTGDNEIITLIGNLDNIIAARIETNNNIINEVEKTGNKIKARRKIDELATKNTNEIISTNRISNKLRDAIDKKTTDALITLQKRAETLKILYVVSISLSLVLLVVVYFIIRSHLKARKESELALSENRQLLYSIIDNASNPIFIKLINGEYILANRRFEKLFGGELKTVVGKSDEDIFPHEAAEQMRNDDLEVIKAGKERRFEQVLSHDNQNATYYIVKFPLFDPRGKVYAVAGIATDISEQISEESHLRASQEEFQVGFDAAPDAIIVIDEKSEIIKWNPKAEKLFKWKAEEVIGKRMHELIMPEHYKQQHIKGMQKYLETGQGSILNRTIEVTAIDKDNREFDIGLTVSAAELKGKRIFVGFIREITDRKKIERETIQNKMFLDSIIENIPDMIFVKEAGELRFVRFNKSGEKLLGYSREELLGKNDYDFFPKDQADAFTAKDREVLNQKKMVEISEEEIDTKKGKLWLHTKKMPILDENGKPIYLLGISEDITEEKKADEERKKAEKMLRENEMKLELILENIGEGVVVTDSRKRVILSNQMAEEILGSSALADWSLMYDIYNPDNFTVFPAQDLPVEKALKGQVTNEIEFVLVDVKTNSKKLIKANGHPIVDEKNQVIAAVVTLRDITQFRQLQKELEETEQKYRRAIGFNWQENINNKNKKTGKDKSSGSAEEKDKDD